MDRAGSLRVSLHIHGCDVNVNVLSILLNTFLFQFAFFVRGCCVLEKENMVILKLSVNVAL